MLQHLYFFSGPLVVVVAIILGCLGSDIHWTQVPVIMAGAAIWDFGWHAKIHHNNLWTAKLWVRLAGIIVVAVGISIGIVIKYVR